MELDTLTGVLSRKVILREIQKRCLENKKFAVLFLDLNKFKLVNDTYGHFAGDFVLKEFVKRIKKVLRKSDLIGRYGGDEFLIILDDIEKEDVVKVAKKIVEVSKEPYFFDNQKISFTSVSIGISFCQGDKSFTEIIENSDKAMYFAKRFLSEKFAFYEEIFSKDDGNIRSEFIEGFENGEIFLKLKPIFKNNEIFAFEIVPVWINIYFNELEYKNFEYIIKEINYEIKFDEYILNNIYELFDITDKKLFVQLSDKFFKSDYFINFLNKFDKLDRLVFEISESALINNFNIEKIENYKISLCINKFTSNMFDLINKKIDFIKFNINFEKIDESKQYFIIESLKFFSKAIKAKLIINNIQNEDHLKLLEKLQIEYSQGDFLSKAHFPLYFKVKHEI